MPEKANPNQQFLNERLKLSVISLNAAKYAGIKATPDGFLIPYFDQRGKPKQQMRRTRLSNPRGGCKYLQPKDTGCEVYWPRVKGQDWLKILKNPKEPVAIVEGELKALCLCLAGVSAVGIGGVWNTSRNKELLPDLKLLAAGGRDIFIIFDSDAKSKPQVSGARYWLANEMFNAGAKIHISNPPDLQEGKTGADDLVRIENLHGEELSERLKELEDPQGFPAMRELLRLNAKYVYNLKTGWIHEINDPERSWPDLLWARSVEKATCKITTADGKTKAVSAPKLWLKYLQRSEVYDRIFEPLPQSIPISETRFVNQNGECYLNDWRGWASEPKADAGGIRDYWKPLLDHIFQARHGETKEEAEERERCRHWFECWLAWPVQNPGCPKILSAIGMVGPPDGGKTTIGVWVGRAVYGQHFQEITQRELGGNFNEYVSQKCFLMGSEMTSGEPGTKRSVADYCKNLITGETIYVNKKNKPQYSQKNIVNIYLSSNYADAFTLDGGDRRYFIWETPAVALRKERGDEWIEAAYKYFQSEQGKSALHYHLLHLPIDRKIFDPLKPPPDTAAKQRAKEYSQNDAERWVAKLVADPGDVTGYDERVFRIEEMWDRFRAQSQRPPSRRPFDVAFSEKFTHFRDRPRVKIYHAGGEFKTGRYEEGRPTLWFKKSEAESLTPAKVKSMWQAQVKEREMRTVAFKTVCAGSTPGRK